MEDTIKIFESKFSDLTKNIQTSENSVLSSISPLCIDTAPKQEKYIQAYILTLSEVIKNSRDTTLEGLYKTIEEIKKNLLRSLTSQGVIRKGRICISIEAISEVMDHLIHRYTSKKLGEELGKLKDQLVGVINNVYNLTLSCQEKINENFCKVLDLGTRILVYGYNSEILYALINARKLGKKFMVYVSQYNENDLSSYMFSLLKISDINCALIPGLSTAYYLLDVDIVITGADGVCENGGIINKIGTFTTAICAKNSKKQMYVICDSLKMLKMYVLDQKDLEKQVISQYKENDEHIIDYTPPEFITMFITDLGIMTPSALSDELIQLYYK